MHHNKGPLAARESQLANTRSQICAPQLEREVCDKGAIALLASATVWLNFELVCTIWKRVLVLSASRLKLKAVLSCSLFKN